MTGNGRALLLAPPLGELSPPLAAVTERVCGHNCAGVLNIKGALADTRNYYLLLITSFERC